jgi:hypothetical protein
MHQSDNTLSLDVLIRDRALSVDGGEDGVEFVRWADAEPGAYVAGTLEDIWQSSHGTVATISIDSIHGVEGDHRLGDPAYVGLQLTALARSLTEDDIGSDVVIGFEGWATSRSGREYRKMIVRRLR